MCLSFCGGTGTACGDGTCIETSLGGQFCAKTCSSDADCRASEGYVCDPTWHGCSLPGLSAPKFAACEGETLAKSSFTGTQVSSAKGPGLYDFEATGSLDKAGDLVALYIAGTQMGAPNPLGEVRIGAKGDVTQDVTVKGTHEDHFDPWMAADAAGALHAVWLAFDGGHAPEKNMAIEYAASSDSGKTWSTPVPVNAAADCTADGCLDKPMIATAGKKDVYVLYSSESTDGERMVASHDGGKTWGKDSIAVPTPTYGGVATDGKGAIYVTGSDADRHQPYGGPGHAILFARSTDGKAFDAAVKVSADDESIPFFFVNPAIAVDKKGIVHVAYASGGPDLAWRIVLATSKDHGKTWSRMKVADAPACENQSVPNLAIDPKGKVIVMWAESAGGGREVLATCDGAKCGEPSALGGAWAEYSFARHATMWTGEYQTLAVDAKRKVVHALWSQTVEENGVPTARIFHASGKLK
jgi:hypothetical protein